MADVTAEIATEIQRAADSGGILVVALAAKKIAALCGGSPQQIATRLTEAGIRAGVTMQFGAPE